SGVIMGKKVFRTAIILTIFLFAAACKTETAAPQVLPTSTVQAAEPLESTAAPTPEPLGDDSIFLTVLYTNDEHGWIEGRESGSGAATLAGLWADAGYENQGDLLILSGGDNWTGPAISTWFDGQSMVAVMNVMGYHAAAIGNHEFDFGLDVLQTRLAEAEFPYLSANTRYKAGGSTPTDLGIQAYTIVDTGVLRVGLIGLTLTDTPSITNPEHTAVFDFIDYETALREVVPQVRAEGVDMIIVPAHVCTDELIPLASAVSDLNVALLGGGHCHERFAQQIGDTVLISAGDGYASYAYAAFELDPGTKDMISVDYGIAENRGGVEDTDVAQVVAHWKAETDRELDVVIGYLEDDLSKRGDRMAALITEAWLAAYPTADVAITNWGGMRDRIPAGEITMADVVGVMPFNNVLVDVKMTGAQLASVLAAGRGDPPVGGIHRENGQWVLNKTGLPIEPDEMYAVLVNDFMYAGGDNLTMLVEYDPDAYNTSISWRQPVIDWIEAQETTAEKPLDALIDALMD
ncbi:MAG: bifunctional UDP-sugar hydrolase/5'-nucleotidase, partial [Chloroflexota bacterium]